LEGRGRGGSQTTQKKIKERRVEEFFEYKEEELMELNI
jgi:hypothetical protein